MKHYLSYCEIEQLSDNVFEVIVKKGIVIDKKCIEEGWNFWTNLRDKPFGLLVNSKNTYTHSFVGSQYVGKHPLQRKTAILCNNPELLLEIERVIEVKKMVGNYIYHRVFTNREEAIEWLSDI